jgi:hypothetical protein
VQSASLGQLFVPLTTFHFPQRNLAAGRVGYEVPISAERAQYYMRS